MSRFLRWVGLLIAVAILGIGTQSTTNAASSLSCSSVQTSGARTSYWGCNYQPSAAKGEAAAREALAANIATLRVQADANSLRLVEVKNGLASTTTRFMQTIDGTDVYMGWVTVVQGPTGKVHTIHTQYYPDLTMGNRAPALAQTDAERVAADAAGVTVYRSEPRTKMVWYPRSTTTAILAWETTIFSDAPLGDFYTLVDAASGAVLLQDNRVALDDGSGYTYEPNPVQLTGDVTLDDGNNQPTAALDAARVPMTLQGLDSGTGLIKGEFVDLATLNSPTLPDNDADEANRVYLYQRNDDRFEQVVVYSALDRVQRYIHSLGFDDDGPDNNGIRDFPTKANAHWYTADNSFYSTGDDAVHFGNGGVDDSEDVEVVAHEYGHAVQHDQNSSWGSSQEMGAMGEGFGDYLAATVYYDMGDFDIQSANNACIAEWDATAYSGSNPPCLRRTDGTKHYPEDLNGQVHDDGEIWSRALWDLRRYIGGRAADQIILEHHFSVPAAATMIDAARTLLQADVDVNGGANANAIREAMCTRGILTGADCTPITADFSLVGAPRTENICAGDPGEYWLTVAKQGTWNSAVSLSATGIPAGVTATFSQTSVTPDAMPSLTIGSTAALASGTYTFTVSAAGNSVTNEDELALRVQTDAAAPSLTAPANGAANVALAPTFTWTSDGQSNSYLVEVATDINFSTVVLTSTTTLETYTAGEDLTANTVYYWRVTPTNDCGTGTASAPRIFSTGATAPTAITLDTFAPATTIPVWGIAGVALLGMVVAGLVARRRR